MRGCQYRMTSYDQDSGGPDFSPAYGIQLHDPRLLEYVGATESARLLSRSPEYWLHHLGHEKTLGAALQLQHNAGLILSNVQVLQQFVTLLNRASSKVIRVSFGRAPFPADAMQQVVPSWCPRMWVQRSRLDFSAAAQSIGCTTWAMRRRLGPRFNFSTTQD